jgi:hypothetical protein
MMIGLSVSTWSTGWSEQRATHTHTASVIMNCSVWRGASTVCVEVVVACTVSFASTNRHAVHAVLGSSPVCHAEQEEWVWGHDLQLSNAAAPHP